jgi:hypothetical protein
MPGNGRFQLTKSLHKAIMDKDVLKQSPEQLNIVQSLIAQNADVNGDFDGWAPLHRTVMAMFVPMVQLLLSVKADVEHKPTRGEGAGKTALDCVAAVVWVDANVKASITKILEDAVAPKASQLLSDALPIGPPHAHATAFTNSPQVSQAREEPLPAELEGDLARLENEAATRAAQANQVAPPLYGLAAQVEADDLRHQNHW